MLKRKKKRPARNSAWPARSVADNFENSLLAAVAGDRGARLSVMLEGLFDNIDLKRAIESLPEELPEEYLCVADRETARMVFDYFEFFDPRNEKAAREHIRLCAHCDEAVTIRRELREAAVGQKGLVHPASRGGLERGAEAGETEAAQYAGVVGVERQGI